ncbi:hypothetical protein IGI37_002900 [Enterococcus sp. AZ194]|uniref:hypothetical protein n=1 Tax=Enterococcus sp. AZ194 TaxID=2774629 RepID=UPI003F26B4C8
MNEQLKQCFENLGIFIEKEEGFRLSDYIDDSLSFISLVVEIEENFNIEIEDRYLNIDLLESFQDIVDLIRKIKFDDEEKLST